MRVVEDLSFKMYDFDGRFWEGAERTYNYIRDLGKLDELEDLLEDIFPDGVTLTDLNDYLWFNDNEVYADLGIKPPYAEGKTKRDTFEARPTP